MTRYKFVSAKSGERFWLPQCIGGAVYGKTGCTCGYDFVRPFNRETRKLERKIQ